MPDIMKLVTLISAELLRELLWFALSSISVQQVLSCVSVIICRADSLLRHQVLETYATFVTLDVAHQ